jgi:hypothetical protein
MQINDSKKLKDIQTEFHQKFSCLKLEFYEGEHISGQPMHANKQLNPKLTIGEVRKVNKEGDLSIAGQMKVSTLEDRFWKDYGLNVQVFRRSGNLWLQTSTTDHWTLTEQNGKGERSKRSYDDMHS